MAVPMLRYFEKTDILERLDFFFPFVGPQVWSNK